MSKYHYAYRITNKVEQKHYYGARSSNVHPSEDLGIKYFSSSTDKVFLAEQVSSPENFKYKVIKIFETREEAIALEIKLHAKFNVGVNESFYNKAKQTSARFDTSGKITVKDVFGNSFSVDKEDERFLSDELVFINKGKKHSEETRSKISEKHIGKKHSEETRSKISKSTLKRIDEYGPNISDTFNFKGKKHSEETKDKISKSLQGKPKLKIKCPICGFLCSPNNAKLWHFDNCKRIIF